jgi:surface polysaccharide O-acyltransferase-like enzyme
MSATPADVKAPRRLSFDLLRILSILGVVAIHTFGAIPPDPDERGTAGWVAALFLSSGMAWVVPVFVMLAGALSLRQSAFTDGAAAFIRRRATRILPAVVIWTLVYLVGVRMLLLGEPISPTQFVTILVDGTAYPHLYFLYLIAGLYLIAPVLAAFLRDGGDTRARVTATIALAFTLVVFMIPGVLALQGVDRPVTLQTLTFWLGYVGYFLMGYALSLLRPSRRWVIAAAAGFVLLDVLIVVQAAEPDRLRVLNAFVHPEYLGVGVALLAICAFVVGVRTLDAVRVGDRVRRFVITASEASFGVFLVHLVVLLVPYSLLAGFRDHTSFAQTALAYVAIVVTSFAISIGARRVPGLRRLF